LIRADHVPPRRFDPTAHPESIATVDTPYVDPGEAVGTTHSRTGDVSHVDPDDVHGTASILSEHAKQRHLIAAAASAPAAVQHEVSPDGALPPPPERAPSRIAPAPFAAGNVVAFARAREHFGSLWCAGE